MAKDENIKPTVDPTQEMQAEIKVITLEEEQCDDISFIEANKSYTKGKRAEAGKTFNVYRYNGVAFTVLSDNPFVKDQENGTLFRVKLIVGEREKVVIDDEGVESTISVKSYEFDTSTSTVQKLNREKFKSNIAVLRKLDQQPVTDELLKALQNA